MKKRWTKNGNIWFSRRSTCFIRNTDAYRDTVTEQYIRSKRFYEENRIEPCQIYLVRTFTQGINNNEIDWNVELTDNHNYWYYANRGDFLVYIDKLGKISDVVNLFSTYGLHRMIRDALSNNAYYITVNKFYIDKDNICINRSLTAWRYHHKVQYRLEVVPYGNPYYVASIDFHSIESVR